MGFLEILSYVTFLVAIGAFREEETVTDRVTWVLRITRKQFVILRSEICWKLPVIFSGLVRGSLEEL